MRAVCGRERRTAATARSRRCPAGARRGPPPRRFRRPTPAPRCRWPLRGRESLRGAAGVRSRSGWRDRRRPPAPRAATRSIGRKSIRSIAGRDQAGLARRSTGGGEDAGNWNGSVTVNVEPTPISLVSADRTAEQLREALAQRQAEPGAAQALLDRRLDLGEVLEDRVLQFLRDADAGVGHRERDRVVVVLHRCDAHLALGRELERVGDVVAQDLRQLAVVGEQCLLLAARLVEDQHHVRVDEDRLEHAAQRREQVDELEPLRRDLDAAGLDLRQVEQVVDHLAELDRGAVDEADLALLLLGQRPVDAVDQHAGQPADRR